jgi:hypothetical protein
MKIFCFMGSTRYFYIMFRLSILALILLLTTAFKMNAQSFKHPYSHYGIGILEDNYFVENAGMAGLSVTHQSDKSFNPQNPASYSHLKFTSFDVAMKGKIFNLQQDELSYTKNLISFGYFSLGFPINTKYGWGASFGLLPVSRIGYNSVIYETVLPDSLNKTEVFNENGGFNKAYLGTSVRLLKNLSVGANLYYLFGNTELYHSMFFTGNANYFGISTEQNTFYGSVGFDFGVQYHAKLFQNIKLGLGATMSTPVSLKVVDDNNYITFANSDSSFSYKDTIFQSSNALDNQEIPQKFSAGISLYVDKKWNFGLDYSFQEWSKFRHIDTSITLSNYQEFVVGGQFTPGKPEDPYFKRITYRFGIKYAFSYMNIPKDLSMNPIELYNPVKTGISFGAEFPINRSFSAINTGIELGKIGVLEDDIIRELYMNIYLGFRLNDIWFNKRKID